MHVIDNSFLQWGKAGNISYFFSLFLILIDTYQLCTVQCMHTLYVFLGHQQFNWRPLHLPGRLCFMLKTCISSTMLLVKAFKILFSSLKNMTSTSSLSVVIFSCNSPAEIHQRFLPYNLGYIDQSFPIHPSHYSSQPLVITMFFSTSEITF